MDMRKLPVVIRRDVPAAFLPNNYVVACNAIKACARVDEAADMANKAAAIATYAREAADKTLKANAEKIRVRAERRVGELLLELYPNRTCPENVVPKFRQSVAIRLTRIPETRFEGTMDGIAEEGEDVTSRRVILRYRDKKEATTEKTRRTKRKEEDVLADVFDEVSSTIHRFHREISGDCHLSDAERRVFSWKEVALGCADPHNLTELMEALNDIRNATDVLRDVFSARALALHTVKVA